MPRKLRGQSTSAERAGPGRVRAQPSTISSRRFRPTTWAGTATSTSTVEYVSELGPDGWQHIRSNRGQAITRSAAWPPHSSIGVISGAALDRLPPHHDADEEGDLVFVEWRSCHSTSRSLARGTRLLHTRSSRRTRQEPLVSQHRNGKKKR